MQILRRIFLLCLCATLLLAGCGKKKTDTPASTGAATTYTVSVCTAGGMGLEDITVYFYEDSTLQELVAVSKTDADGKASFTDVARDTYVAVLKDVPTGYATEAFYLLTGELTEIVLGAGQMDETDLEELTYKLGDAMMNFSVTAPDGTEYTFNGLFEGKKAVVLNFFYNECEPCKAEFPHLQAAYEQYSDDIAVLAMNPVNADGASVAALQKELGLTYIFITHDLSVVNHFSDDIAVMYLGKMVEKAPAEELFANPLHPYTKALLSAIPIPQLGKKKERILLKGEISSPIEPGDVCRFQKRCYLDCCAECNGKCAPELREVSPGHFVACHCI